MPSSESDSSRPLILLIEDNRADATLLMALFKEASFAGQLQWVDTGEEALDRISETLPDLILLDLSLPKMSGFEVLKQIRLRPELKTLPIIILTSSGLPHDSLKSQQLGADAFIVKPRDLVELDALVTRLIGTEFPRFLKTQPSP